MNGLGMLIGSILILFVGLWLALSMAEFVLVMIGWVLFGLGVVGAIMWFMNRSKTHTGTGTSNRI